MQITSDTVALVTGANRGIGREFTAQLVAAGAQVFAAARDPRAVDVTGATPIALDVTDAAAVAALPDLVPGVTLVVNNAGITRPQGLVTGDLDVVREEMETNLWGSLAVVRALAPVLAGNGGGAILNVLSALSWVNAPGANGYSMSKAAGWSMTNGIRQELADQGTQVTGLYLAATDTDMMAGWDLPKNDPADVVRVALEGVESGAAEVLADDDTRAAKAALSGVPAAV